MTIYISKTYIHHKCITSQINMATFLPDIRVLPHRAIARDVSNRLKRRMRILKNRIERFMDEAHPNEDDYMIPSTLRYPFQELEYDVNGLLDLLNQITDLEAFLEFLEEYYDPNRGYGNYDDEGVRNMENLMMGLFYRLEVLYSRIYTDNTPKMQIYCIHIHHRLEEECDRDEIYDILIDYFSSLDDTLVQELIERDFLSHFVKELVEVHFGSDEIYKMRDMMNDLYGNLRIHKAWVMGYVIHYAFNPLLIESFDFTPGEYTTTFFQSVVAHFETSITFPTDDVVSSLVRTVVMGFDISFDEFCEEVVIDYLPNTLQELEQINVKSGVGVEYLQSWVSLLERRLSISTTRRNLLPNLH